MEQQVNFSILNTGDDQILFTQDGITMTVGKCYFRDGMHLISDPSLAVAFFKCCGKLYHVEGTEGATTVEDWFLDELVPRREMIDILISIPAY